MDKSISSCEFHESLILSLSQMRPLAHSVLTLQKINVVHNELQSSSIQELRELYLVWKMVAGLMRSMNLMFLNVTYQRNKWIEWTNKQNQERNKHQRHING